MDPYQDARGVSISPRRSLESIERRNHMRKAPYHSRGHPASMPADDVSSASEDDEEEEEEEENYATDFTTPAPSDSGPEDVESEEVEDFREREYPQLKGKIYMDHGGTTVRLGQCWDRTL